MAELTYLDAILLGAVQGLTEFLPISSSAHLVVTQRLLNLDSAGLAMHVFDGVAHVGTVLSVFVVFASSFFRYTRRLIAELQGRNPGRRYATRVLLLGVVALIPTGIIGLAFKDHFERSFGSLLAVGVGLMITGGLLLATSRAPRGRRGWRQFSLAGAAVIGIAQGCAISPGISRSGATICAATLCGIRRRWAAEFSFFIAFPAIVGATALKLGEACVDSGAIAGLLPWGPMVVGGLVAFVVGTISLVLLLQVVRRAQLHHFAWYCLAAGLAVCIMS
jgi:undecaprenyl-diphosphatase